MYLDLKQGGHTTGCLGAYLVPEQCHVYIHNMTRHDLKLARHVAHSTEQQNSTGSYCAASLFISVDDSRHDLSR